MITQEMVNNAIADAEAGKSMLTPEILSIRGFSPPTIRHLINNLSRNVNVYLEVGVLCGGTFVSSFNQNTVSIGFEDFSENFQADIPGYDKDELDRNIGNHYSRAKQVVMCYDSYYNLKKEELPKGVEMYLFDGEHGINSHAKALHWFIDSMADRFLFLVDDISWPQVKIATDLGFYFLQDKIEIVQTWELGKDLSGDPQWHNGFNIYLINKKK